MSAAASQRLPAAAPRSTPELSLHTSDSQRAVGLAPQPRMRIQSVDALRGLIMIIMALDHDRDFIHAGAQSFQPEDLAHTSTVLFLTRWVTHICAPVFMFTAGIGAYLWLRRGHSKRELATFLVTRGLWLIVLEVTVVRFAMLFNFTTDAVILEVIWALGWCMMCLAVLIYLPVAVLAVVSVAIIALHNLADGIDADSLGGWSWLWHFLHQNGPIPMGSHTLIIAYPLVPWVAVMAAGFCFGRVLELDVLARRKLMVRLGLALVLAFIVLRAINSYGDPAPWIVQRSWAFSALAFLRTTKYPPSLQFLLMTLGPALLILAWFDGRRFARGNPLVVFGRVPLFFFLVHLYLLHAVGVVLMWVRYGNAPFLFSTLPALGGPRTSFPANLGWSLPVVYLVWVGAIVALYPICRWFGSLKQRRDDWWLSYL